MLMALLAMTTSAFAADAHDESNYNEQLNERDWDALRDFINSKRAIDVEACSLVVSGDVRFEWRHMTESQSTKNKGRRILRGANAYNRIKNIPISRNDFDIEFNLRFDYVCDRAWAGAHIQYDNSAGVDDNEKSCCVDPEGYHGSGNCDDLCLKRAIIGYNVFTCDETRLDIEIGRRNLYSAFDSKVQFLSRFDGILLKYETESEALGEWYTYLASFVVDEKKNHFGFVGETGLLDIAESGWDLKYSLIHWPKWGKTRCRKDCKDKGDKIHLVRNPRGFKFINSQVTTAYHIKKDDLPCWMPYQPAKVYGAVVYNHYPVRPPKKADSHKRHPFAWYVGFTMGEVVNEGDWAFDIQYQWVGATSIPDDDVSGIGRGNVLGESFTERGRGNTNFKGLRTEFLYALTDNLSIDTIWEFSRQIDKNIGGRHHYSKFEVEAIYAF